MTDPHATAAGIERRLKAAIDHANSFGERAVLLPMEMAETLRKEAAELAVHLAPRAPQKPARKRT